MRSEILLGAVIVAALMLYLLLAGADFGGGVWDLLAFGPRRGQQRKAIEHAIGPIWEANHVWLILVVVVLFTGFPAAFAALSTALHVPLTLFLMGVVFRGSAFVFRSSLASGDAGHAGDADEAPGPHPAADDGDRAQRRWGVVFSLASLVSPVLLGMVVGAIASGRLHDTSDDFFRPWLAPFPLAVGLYSLSLCAFLAATYLTAEVTEPALRRDFRGRALAAGVAVGACALLAFLLSVRGAPRIREGLTHRTWAWPLHLATAVVALSALAALWRSRFKLARVLVAIQTVAILAGWAASQYPYLLVPDFTIWNAAAPPETRRLLLIFLAAGVPVLLPSLIVLFRVFKAAGQARPGRGGSRPASPIS